MALFDAKEKQLYFEFLPNDRDLYHSDTLKKKLIPTACICNLILSLTTHSLWPWLRVGPVNLQLHFHTQVSSSHQTATVSFLMQMLHKFICQFPLLSPSCFSVSWRSGINEVKKTTSFTKSRDEILKPTNQTLSNPLLWPLSVNNIKRIGEKVQPWYWAAPSILT